MFDVAVIGGGPGGYVAALFSAMKGKKTVLFEKDKIGGTCLNCGCIPTKSMLACAELFSKIKKSSDFGIEVLQVKPDFEKMYEQKEKIISDLRKGIEFLIEKRKIDFIKEEAFIVGEKKIKAGEELYDAENIIFATGSKPANLPFFNIDHDRIIDSTDALQLKDIPDEIIIIGGGVIGIEFASIWSSFEKKVTIVELADNILPFADEEISKKMKLALKKQKVKIITGKKVERVDRKENKCIIELDNGKVLESDIILCATGRSVNTDACNIELDFDGKFIKVNSKMQTSVKNIYAIGDIVSTMQLAHVASSQAIVAVNNICGIESHFNYRAVPNCVYSIPEAAWVGLTEKEAIDQEGEIKKGYFKFSALGKAMALREKEGFVKVISDKMDNILGVHIMGPKATELISEAVTAYASRLKIYEWAGVIHAHPTLSEGIMEALHDVHQESVHQI